MRCAYFAVFTILVVPTARAQVPDAIAAPGQTVVAHYHAEGAQIYECKPDGAGKLIWQFREPIATLMADGQTIGRHYAGPSWELADGNAVTGKASANAAGATSSDIPWLRLDVLVHRGTGRLDSVSTVQRIETKGGVAPATCTTVATFLDVPYSAEYVFLRRP